MRRRTITLVVVGLVLALFVLPAAAQAWLGDEPVVEAEEVVPPVITGDSWDYYTGPHVVMYTYPVPDDLPPDCSLAEGVIPLVEDGELVYDGDQLVFVNSEGVVVVIDDLDAACRAVLIEGPNGQVNHGQFVSNMVHDLKSAYDKEDGPFGQWVQKFAHDDQIGKGPLKVKANEDDPGVAELAEADDDDDDDGHGRPEHANDKSKKPKN